MVMYDGVYFRPRLHSRPMDDALTVRTTPVGIDGFAIQFEFHQVIELHQFRCS